MTSESLQQLTEIAPPTNPFPGLRPFEFHENHLFFGREGQSEQLIAKLSVSRFLAVVGTSGSGKSSLVRAGLLPALFGGLMGKTGSRWRVAIMRPGNDPIGNLAHALDTPDVFGTSAATPSLVQHAMTEALLRRGSLGLVEVARQANFSPGENLLVLVDQFEELFRVGQDTSTQATDDEKAAFIKLLLEAKSQHDVAIYVVLTMRSDYLGDCARFWDLPEAINESQYLIPRLTREQRREVITGPVAVGGATITPRLVNRILNDVGDDPDQLPLLQHALMRTWEQWQDEQQPSEPLDLRHYEAIGSLTNALSRHADEAYDELSPAQQKLAEQMFKCLTEKGTDNREVRRPQTVRELCAVTQADEQAVIAAIDVFRRSGRSFLMPPAEVELTADSLIDISHESLIRNWHRLKTWVDEEALSAATYKRLADRADLHKKGKEELLRDPGLQFALEWQEQNQPNEAWARRYHSGFAATVKFLQQSKKAQDDETRDQEQQRQRELQRTRKTTVTFAVLFLIASVFAGYSYYLRNEAVARERANRRLVYVANMNLASQDFAQERRLRGYQMLDSFLPVAGAEQKDDPRDFTWYLLWKRNHQELTTFTGHSNVVWPVAFSPDGKTLASGSEDQSIKLWDVATRRELATLTGHSNVVWSLAFSPDGKTLASSSEDYSIKLWDVATRRELATLTGHSNVVWSVAFSPDGKTLASGSGDRSIKLWDVATHRELTTLTGHSNVVWSVAFSPDGKTLASGSGDRSIKLWDVATHRELTTLTGHSKAVWSLAFSPDGKTLASSSEDQSIKLWDVATHRELTTLTGHSKAVWSLAFSPDGKTLASGSGDQSIKLWGDYSIKLWDVATRRELATLTGHSKAVWSVAFSPDGKTLASSSEDYSIKLWDVATRRELATLTGHSNGVRTVAFSPDGKTLASSSEDYSIKLWDVATRRELATLTGHSIGVVSLAFSPDGKTLASGSWDRSIKLWDVATSRELATLTGHSNYVLSVAFSPDGKTLASSSADKTIRLYIAATDEEVERQRNQ